MKKENQKITILTFFTLEVMVSLAVFIGTFAVFFYLSWQVFLDKNEQFDKIAFSLVASQKSETLTNILEVITYFASFKFLVSVPPTLVVFFLFFRRWRWFSAYIFTATMGSFLLNQYLKNNFGRNRPITAFYHQAGYSFPSGHAMIGAAFYGILAYLVWKNVKNVWLRSLICLLLGLFQLIISYSRIYLNVHYATDVVAGLAAGIFWLLLTIILLRQLQKFLSQAKK